MSNKQIKQSLLVFLDRIKIEILSFENFLSQEEKRLKGSLEKWSAKDTLVHLGFWDDHFNSQVSMAKNGERVPRADDYLDQINDGIFIEHSDQPFSDAQSFLEITILNATILLESFSANELNDKFLFKYLNGRTLVDNALGTFGWHIPHHLSDFYLKTSRAEKAIEIQEIYARELQKFHSWKANSPYNLACFYTKIGNKEKAITNLKISFLVKPNLIEWAKEDKDLDSLKRYADFIELLKIS